MLHRLRIKLPRLLSVRKSVAKPKIEVRLGLRPNNIE